MVIQGWQGSDDDYETGICMFEHPSDRDIVCGKSPYKEHEHGDWFNLKEAYERILVDLEEI